MKWQPIFSTPAVRSWNWTFPGMIAGALFLHAMAFYLIQASSFTAGKKEHPSARLIVLNPNKARDQAALAWIENHDPAAFFQADSPQPPHLFDPPPYQPSYEKALPVLLPVVKETVEIAHRSIFPPGPVPLNPPASSSNAEKMASLRTRIEVSPSIDLQPAAHFAPPLITGNIPLPARFLVVAAGPDRATCLFLLQSSGNDRLDEAARGWLAPAVFLKTGQSSGWAEIFWGDEIWKKEFP